MNNTPNTVTLTAELIHSASSHPSGDGFTKEQLAVLGISWPPSKGWLSALIGQTIPLEKFTLFKMGGDEKRAKNLAKKSVPASARLTKAEEIPVTVLAVMLAFSEDTKGMGHITRAAVAQSLVCEFSKIASEELSAHIARD
jgi:hypothetical protein